MKAGLRRDKEILSSVLVDYGVVAMSFDEKERSGITRLESTIRNRSNPNVFRRQETFRYVRLVSGRNGKHWIRVDL